MNTLAPNPSLGGDAIGAGFEAVWRALLEALAQEPADLARLSAISQHLPWPVTLKDPAGRLLAANPALRLLTGLPPEATIGHTYEDLAGDHPHLALQSPSVRASDEAAWAARARVTFMHRQLSPDGTLLGLRVHKQGLLDAAGERRFMLALAGFAAANAAAESQAVIAEPLYRLLAAHTSDLVLVLEPDGRCRYASPSLERLLGDAPRTWLGTPLEAHADAADAATLAVWRQDAGRADAPGPARRHELVGTDGRRRWFDSRLSALRDDADDPQRITGWVFSGRDVTDSHLAMAALQATDRRLAEGLHMTRVGVYDIDLQHGTAWFSPEFERLLGYPRGEFVRTWHRLDLHVHPDDLARAEALQSDLLAGRIDSWDFEIRQRRALGEPLWVRSRGRVIERDPTGRPQRLIGTLQDVGERVRHTAQLEDARQRLALALKVSGTGVAEFDLDRGEVRLDATLSQMQGFGAGETVCTLDQFMAVIDPSDAARAAELLAAVRTGGEVPMAPLRVRRPDTGQLRWLELSAAPLRLPGRSLVLGAAWDVTDRRLAEEALRHAAGREALLVRLADAVQALDGPRQVAETAARILGEHLDVARAGLGAIEGDHSRVVGQWTAGVEPLPPRLPRWLVDETTTPADWRGDLTVVTDSAHDDRLSAAARALHEELGIAALVRVRLRQHDQWVGAFSVHSRTPRHWTPAEIELVRDVAERTWAWSQQARARNELQDSEERYRALFESMNEGFALVEPIFDDGGRLVDQRFIELNPAFERLTGLPRAQALGRRTREVVPDLDPAWFAAAQRALDTGQPQRHEAFVPQDERWHEATAFACGEGRLGWLYRDNTQAKRGEATLRAVAARQAFLVRLSDALRPLADAQDLLGVGAALLGDHLQASRVVFSSIDGDDAVVRAMWSPDTPALAARIPLVEFGSEIVAAYRQGETLAVDDVAADPRIATTNLADYRAAQIAAFAGLMLLREGRWVAVLEVQQATPRHWSADEVDLIREVAERLWIAAQHAQAEAAMRESESRQQFLLQLADAVAPVDSPREAQALAARLLAERLQADRVGFYTLAVGEVIVEADHAPGVPSMVGRHPVSDFGGLPPLVTRGEVVVVDDLGLRADLQPEHRETFARLRIGALIGVPLVKDGRVVAGLAVHAAAARAWTPAEVSLAREAAERTWAAVERARTERSLAEAQAALRDFAARQEDERDQERHRIALDVHDELGQRLTALKLQLGMLESRFAGPARGDVEAGRALERIQAQLDATMEVTRDIAARLRLPGEGLGLASGALALAEEFALRTDMPCLVHCTVCPQLWNVRGGSPADTDAERLDASLPSGIVGPLLRILQESLTNIARHADAWQVNIHLSLDGRGLQLEVADDGVGFDPARVPSGRLGLVGMRERAARIGAQIEWRPRSPCGTLVAVRWSGALKETR